jgi:tetratricopeptide (TPR) repeat protein
MAEAQVATWATSETLWRQAAIAVPDSARARIELGTIYGRAGRPAEAAAEFTQALNLPMTINEGKDLFPDLSQALLDQGKAAEAIPYLERSRQLSPERADICHQLAAAYLSQNRKDDAIAAWREAVRLNPNYEEAYFAMGVVLAANGRREEARQAFTEVVRINPSRQDARQALAMLKK